MGSLEELGAPGFDAAEGTSYPGPTVVLPNRATPCGHLRQTSGTDNTAVNLDAQLLIKRRLDEMTGRISRVPAVHADMMLVTRPGLTRTAYGEY